MTTPARKPPLTNPNRRSFIQQKSAARSESTTPSPPGRNNAASPAPGHLRRHTVLESSGGRARTGSVSARGAAKLPGMRDEQEAENAAALEELRNKLEREQERAERAQREMEALQIRLDEATGESQRLEEGFNKKEREVETLAEKMRKFEKAEREREQRWEAERAKLEKDQEEAEAQRKELLATNQRLKDALAKREREKDAESTKSASRSIRSRRGSSESDRPPPVERVEPESFAPALPIIPQSDLLLQKDKLIESLRLELASTQVLLTNSQTSLTTRITELESQLLHLRTENTRLLEESESFQLLLQQSTLSGDFTRNPLLDTFSDTTSIRSRSPSPTRAASPQPPAFGSIRRKSLSLGNLAEELEEADNRVSDEKYRKLESDYKEDQLSLNSAGTSPPRSMFGREFGTPVGAPGERKALRPLRLVQQEEEDKKRKRGSWMGFGWLAGGEGKKDEVVFERREVE
ncbi:hypothetical protein BJ508DRAFT_380351 [Ascobolus immersus RN42]|uniref:Uncharacterized protein n=1 Tax=Ascobolus immersus RN42 TaxID=1160509 RepID=A0A3N4HSU1_ASCIM|nr:hypothetical protein BJ508DRAFT_380351 [Ascobolus immersus RN42]